MDFSLTPDQEALKSSVRDFLKAECTSEVVRRAAEGSDIGLWAEVSALGWPGLIVPEEFGGIGLGWVEASLLAEELGRSLFPGPLTTCFAATATLLALGTDVQKNQVLPQVAEGETILTLASAGPNTRPDGPNASPDWLVPYGDVADFVVIADADDKVRLVPVDDLDVSALPLVDRTRPLYAASIPGADINHPAGVGYDRAAMLLAAESAGIARKCLEMSIEYTKTRQQFGKPIGSYQAVSHKVADMFLGAEHAVSLFYFAAWLADTQPSDASAAAWRAKIWNDHAARTSALDAIQVHGGIGFTWEHDLHLYLKRAKSNEVLFSTPRQLRSKLADRILGEVS